MKTVDTHRVMKPFRRENAKTRKIETWKQGDTITPFPSELRAFAGFFEPLEEAKQEPQAQEPPAKSTKREKQNEQNNSPDV